MFDIKVTPYLTGTEQKMKSTHQMIHQQTRPELLRKAPAYTSMSFHTGLCWFGASL